MVIHASSRSGHGLPRVAPHPSSRRAALILALCAMSGCALRGVFPVFPMEEVPNRIEHPIRADARLAVLWVGHATALVQMDDKIILTDPVFSRTVGQISERLVEPGLDVKNVPPVDAVLISHLHFDHLSLSSLGALESRIRRLYAPEGGMVYIPDFRFPTTELRTWEARAEDGLAVTAVPERHVGWRYGVDSAWMTKSFTGYVVQYHGLTVYYAGDTGYEPANFRAAAARFPSIDLALLPIAPVHPRSVMEHNHEDPDEALQAFLELHARWMVPIHHDTFINSFDTRGEALKLLDESRARRGLTSEQVAVLAIGEQRVFVSR
jgi:N-acyl-phosphatidylethanolamine-hydrolysing phospholipase D